MTRYRHSGWVMMASDIVRMRLAFALQTASRSLGRVARTVMPR